MCKLVHVNQRNALNLKELSCTADSLLVTVFANAGCRLV